MLLLCVIVLSAWGASAAAAEAPTYTLEGAWKPSTISGHQVGKLTHWTWEGGAAAVWRPAFTGPVRARVFVHAVAHTEHNDPAATVSVTHAEGTHQATISFAPPSGWREVGLFSFAGKREESVRLERTRGTSGAITTRASAARFDVLGASGDEVISSFVLDELTDATGRTVRATAVRFEDAKDHAAAVAIERLATRGIATPAAAGRFSPDEPLTRGEFAVWVTRATGRVPAGDGRSPTATTSEERGAAVAALPELGGGDADAVVSAEAMDGLLDALAERAWRNDLLLEEREQLAAMKPGTRSHGAELLHRFIQHVLQAGPRGEGAWKLAFADEFDGSAIDTSVWSVEAGAPSHIDSSRWPENVVLERGMLRLLTKREERGGKQWTTGNVSTKYQQRYGYFECRMRIGGASGLNNAFWLMTWKKRTDPHHFEIDIAEAKFPSRNNLTLHQWSGEHTAEGKLWTTPFDLSQDFHLYAAEWTADEVVWYVDGEEVFRVKHDFARDAAPIRLSSAVAAFAGALDAARLDGASMDVDWVRAYARE